MMKQEQLIRYWKTEENIAHIHGWDFSHINDRYSEQDDLPWDYEAIVRKHLSTESRLLDIDTGGGEFLLKLKHPYRLTSATEGYAPNVQLCSQTLLPLGIDFKEITNVSALPYPSDRFDVVINRHGDLDAPEFCRVLKRGGVFITQQVGEDNDRELVELLLPGTPRPFPGMNLAMQRTLFEQAGFEILQADEAFRPIRFFDVGALVWFARIIEWEFRGFSVDSCVNQLLEAQRILEKNGSIDATIHRYLIVARKK